MCTFLGDDGFLGVVGVTGEGDVGGWFLGALTAAWASAVRAWSAGVFGATFLDTGACLGWAFLAPPLPC